MKTTSDKYRNVAIPDDRPFAAMDRLVHNATRIELKGESMRKKSGIN
jgi:DNA replication protein DnaC